MNSGIILKFYIACMFSPGWLYDHKAYPGQADVCLHRRYLTSYNVDYIFL